MSGRGRRAPGEGSVFWDESKQRFVAEVTTGYTAAGKRIVRKRTGLTEAEARAKLKQVMRDKDDGVVVGPANVTVAQAVEDWLRYGLAGRAQNTRDKWAYLCRSHVIPFLGKRRLRDLSATDVDEWLEGRAQVLATSVLHSLHQGLRRVLRRAMKRDLVRRNVAELCDVPQGQRGRPSKSLTYEQAAAVLAAAAVGASMNAYVTVSLLTGARTEEMRALTWDHVDLDGRPQAARPVPPSIRVWHSVREHGDTKTRKSRRTLALPARAAAALRQLWQAHGSPRDGLVFVTSTGTALDAANVRRSFRRVVQAAGLDPHDWTPRELRHSFVSLLSDDDDEGLSIEKIAELVGHAGTAVTEAVYRHQLRPKVLKGTLAMDKIFPEEV